LLRRRRLAAGLTQEELADRSGLSVRTIRDLERGTTARPYQASVGRLAEALGLAPASPQSPVAPVPRQLPAAAADFTGRAGELKTLDTLLDSGGGPPGAVVVSAIGGTAGVGKTALAVHWAHRAAGRFPDGQLYVNLRGYDPDQPMQPEDALGDKYEQARAHDGLGRANHAAGDSGQARRRWQHALTLYTELGVPDAGQVRARLAGQAPADRSEQAEQPAGPGH
jgi:transcriptional regulator with XRE-family HTH domain